jgi:hypothetical protein
MERQPRILDGRSKLKRFGHAIHGLDASTLSLGCQPSPSSPEGLCA